MQRMDTFAKNLDRVRRDRGLTINGLAAACGMHRSNMSEIVNGKNSPNLSTMERIAETLEVPLHDLLNPEFSKFVANRG